MKNSTNNGTFVSGRIVNNKKIDNSKKFDARLGRKRGTRVAAGSKKKIENLKRDKVRKVESRANPSNESSSMKINEGQFDVKFHPKAEVINKLLE